MGAIFTRFPDGRLAQRPFGAAGAPRTVYSADITGHVLIHVLYEQLVKYDVQVYEEFFAHRARRRRGPLRRRDRLGPGPRRAARHRGEARDPRHRRHGAHVLRHHQRLLVHRRRHGAGLAGRRAAEGHGVHAVPPDDAEGQRRADHRGLPRRGRLPAQRQGRALHGQGRAQRDGARLPRRRLARGVEGDRRRAAASTAACCSTSRTSAPRRSRRGCPARASWRWTTPASTRIDEPIPVRPGAHYQMGGVDVDVLGRDDRARPVGRRRGRLRVGARREPPRRQLADGDHHVRPPRRPGRRAAGARERRRRRPHRGRRAAPTRTAASPRSSTPRRAPRPWEMRDRLAKTMYDKAGVFRTEETLREARRRSPSCASRRGRCGSTTTAPRSTPTSPRRSSCRPCWSAPTAS